MMVMTAKVNLKKILIAAAAAAVLILALVLVFGNRSQPTAAPDLSANEGRVQFLKELGWEPADSPAESGPVRIPKNPTQVYERYNELQKSRGYDLSRYAGKDAMRYVYRLGPGSPLYATLLVYKGQIIGGDITDTAPRGKILALKSAPAPAPEPSGTVSE